MLRTRTSKKCFRGKDRFPLSAHRRLGTEGRGILRGNYWSFPLRSETPEHAPVLQGVAEGANDRFGDNIVRGYLGKVFADKICIAGVGEDDYIFFIEYSQQAFETKAQKCLTLDELEYLFGPSLSAQRP